MNAIVIVGAPGAGKSTVGSLLAKRLHTTFLDTDKEIERQAGTSISEIFVNSGEATFRSLERDIVCNALRESTGVISLGGGSILDPRTREDLGEHTVIWLKVSAATAAQRVGMNTARPLLVGNVRGTLAKLLKERNAYYQEVADVEIDTDGRSTGEIVSAIIATREASA